MASGNFAERLPEQRIVAELADLSADFNLMAGYVEDHVAKLNEAARQNRELFISSIRAFAAAIDAKDPYTRGHSERVAELSLPDLPGRSGRARIFSTSSGSAPCCTTSARSESKTGC